MGLSNWKDPNIMVTPDMGSGRGAMDSGPINALVGTTATSDKGPAGLWANKGLYRKLPGELIYRGTPMNTNKANPLADVTDPSTGGRQSSGEAAMAGDTMKISWMYVAGAAAVFFLLFRRK